MASTAPSIFLVRPGIGVGGRDHAEIGLAQDRDRDLRGARVEGADVDHHVRIVEGLVGVFGFLGRVPGALGRRWRRPCPGRRWWRRRSCAYPSRRADLVERHLERVDDGVGLALAAARARQAGDDLDRRAAPGTGRRPRPAAPAAARRWRRQPAMRRARRPGSRRGWRLQPRPGWRRLEPRLRRPARGGAAWRARRGCRRAAAGAAVGCAAPPPHAARNSVAAADSEDRRASASGAPRIVSVPPWEGVVCLAGQRLAPGPNVRRRYRVDKGSCGPARDGASSASTSCSLPVTRVAVTELRVTDCTSEAAAADR